ncbi:BREX system ATP-binding domain-containing protein [Candidatus Nitronereus thalassa]|uniref:DUF2791 family P-loop domain-containing protein n=1 Tax=Candidatus Nitronereus thalassa TaxID=3020898 RepID=A0ABU3K6T5_9BACT|nr:BREX system ATP-binding domain-containing protein [Candidatus Nitronereus thalassa]MDT7042106.1 DUF2791 family P-loop domain-containing protein [Candidatus Nitronereus thalassa]
MNMSSLDWLEVMRKEYFQSYLRQGGSAVKFVVSAEEEVRRALPQLFSKMAKNDAYVFAKADAQYTKIHMVDRLFHKIAKQIDWDGLAHLFLSRLLVENGYQVPDDRAAFSLQAIAELNDREEMLLRRELRSWLEKAIYRDSGMCQEFRMAMVRLCLAQLDSGDPNPFLANAVKEWLCGELRLISALKDALIFQKVARHNARDMLASLVYWVRLVGKGGLILTLDISQYMVVKRSKEPDAALSYTAAAAMDAYEVLRQFVDGTDELEGCLIVVIAPEEFVKDERRGLNRYEALKLRIWDDVRDKRRQNPFAPLVRISKDSASPGVAASGFTQGTPVANGEEMLHRRAIEALRAGVPNRDAVQVLGCAQPEIEGQFRRMLENAQRSVTEGTTTKGILLDGGFGTGKSHTLEYLQELALEKNFACSRIVISKETPLYSLVKIYRASIETILIPGKRGGTLAEVAGELNFQGPQYADFYEWVHGPSGELDSRFAATLFLYERMANDRELSHRLVRFWSGDPIGVVELKRYLQACSASNPYTFEKISQTDLALQRFKFASRLMVASGYSGWILLIDEAEIIGRYSLKQRAKSYAELARWMGGLDASSYADLGYKSGLASVIALTDDFQSAILEDKGDREKIPNKLREGRSETDVLLADQAEAGMRLIESERARLVGPYDRMIEETQEKVRTIHASAYHWAPPTIPSVERLSSTRMREYVKGWITEWDLKRLAPEETVDLEVTPLRPSYMEDAEFETPAEEDQAGVGTEDVASPTELVGAQVG